MKTDSGLLLLRTSVRQKTQRQALFKSCLTVGMSIFFIWIAEVAVPLLATIESLGAWKWLASGGALGMGYLPYKKLRWQKDHPEILQADENELALLREDKKVFSIPWKQIESFCFLDRGSNYGIAFTLKSPQTAIESLIRGVAQNTGEINFFEKSLEVFSKQEIKNAISNTKKLPVSPYKSPQLPQFLIQKSKKTHGVDIFLPFFSQHSHLLLQQWYDQNLRDKI